MLSAGMLFVVVRFYSRNFRQLNKIPNGGENSEISTPAINIFEMLHSVRNNLESSKKILLQLKQINITDAPAPLLLPHTIRLDTNVGVDAPTNFVGKYDAAEYANLQTTEDDVSSIDTATMEERIAKIAKDLSGLDEALHRLQFERKNISLTAPSVRVEHISCSPSLRCQYLPIILGQELFAISLNTVQEILQARTLVIEQGASEKARSAISLRGSVVPVIDLNKYFGGKITNVTPSTLIIILILSDGGNQHRVGIKVDGVGKILMVAPEMIEQELVETTEIRNSFTVGRFKTEEHSITLLDVAQWFALKKIPNLDHPKTSQE